MQRNISNKVFLKQNVFPFDNAGKSDVIDRTASNCNDAKKTFKNLENLLKQQLMMLILLNTFLVFSR